MLKGFAKPSRYVSSLLMCAVVVAGFSLPAAGDAQSTPKTSQDDALKAIGDEYIDYLFKTTPDMATSAGVHKYDNDLENYSAGAVKADIKERKVFLDKLEAVDFNSLSKDSQIDWNLLVGNINESLLEDETLQLWKKDPDHYSSGVTRSVFSLIQRDFAPLDERMKNVIARETKIPQALAEGKKNLDSSLIPEIYNEIALEQLPGIVDFFENQLPKTFDKVSDKALQQQFSENNAKCVSALKDYQKFVKENLSGKSKGSFAYGAENFSRKLLCEELIEESLEDLDAKGMQELRRLQKDFKEVTKQVNPNVDPVTAFQSVSSDHPEGDKLIAATKGVLEEIRKFVVEKPICSIPSEERATVDETPAFNRALSFASMDTPGPFEKKAREAFYYVTLPEKDWDAKRVEEHMRSFSYGDLLNTSVHEAYPGHYVQFLWVNHAPTTVRKVFGCSSNGEGWAHYAEQMMLDEGFHKGDAKLRAIQIHDALLRNCRYLVGIRMHTKGWTIDQGVKFFMEEGYQEKANAERETKRGTADPTYLVYTYGKLQILALRKEVQDKDPKNYSLPAFHDAFLKEGFPPVALVRAKMLQLPIKKYF